MLIPPKPSSRHSVSCVGDLVEGVFTGCSRTPLRFVVGIAPARFGLANAENPDNPAVKVCGVCSRHADKVAAAMEHSAPADHQLEPMVVPLNELLDNWDLFFTDLLAALGGEWDVQTTTL